MSSALEVALKRQKETSILMSSGIAGLSLQSTTSTNSTLNIALQNQSDSSQVYAYISGLALDHSGAVFLLQADGRTPYYPSSPPSNGTALAQNCSIALGGPGSTTNVIIPRLAGARIWFCIGNTLTFLLNPGPGLVEPSISNPSDPNYNLSWDFCELTFNSDQLFANISYVDFVALPIALTLSTTSGNTQHVSGMPYDGLTRVSANLFIQNAIDGAGWNNLVVIANGSILRAISPNNGIVMHSSLFSGYYDAYINSVWSKYSNSALTIDTQGPWGNVSGTVVNGILTFPGVGSFSKPTAADIFSCSTGPLAITGSTSIEMGAMIARLAAALNRSTLLINSNQPESEVVATYYQNSTTNHYSRIVHNTNIDGRGYGFPYDDVHPSSGADQSGAVSDGSPVLLTVTVGGYGAYSGAQFE